MTEAERQRAERIGPRLDRQRWTASRIVLRELLSQAAGLPACSVQIDTNAYGKPCVVGLDLHFNLAHSGGRAAYAITTAREVGIDLEWIDPGIDLDAVARSHFSSKELSDFLAIPPGPARVRAFYTGWVRKEAYIKATGQGITCPLQSFDVTIRDDEPARLLRSHRDPAEPERWTMASLDVGTEWAAAVCVQGHPSRIRRIEWPD